MPSVLSIYQTVKDPKVALNIPPQAALPLKRKTIVLHINHYVLTSRNTTTCKITKNNKQKHKAAELESLYEGRF